MKIKIVGLEQNVKITFEGNSYVGRRIHYSYPLTSNNSTGIGCGSQFLNDTKFSNVSLEVGKVYWCDRNYGKLSSFEEFPDK